MSEKKPRIQEAAFPVVNSPLFHEQYGLTKRELFAAMAMQGLLAAGEVHAAIYKAVEKSKVSSATECFAGAAVDYADALIAALESEADDA